MENDHCCERFKLVDGWLREAGAEAEGNVGNALARLSKARDIVRAGGPRLQREPLLFLHEAGCAECDAARASVGGVEKAFQPTASPRLRDRRTGL